MIKLYPDVLDFYLLIPCYNNPDGLLRSLQSIRYPFDKFSVLIVDDGSDIPISRETVLPHLPQGFPVHIIHMPVNSGITASLNQGLSWLCTMGNFKYVARLDCGDICSANRFYRQVQKLDQSDDLDLVGSWCVFKNYVTGVSYQYTTPTRYSKICRAMYFRNLFIHPTVMWRKEVLNDTVSYPEGFPHAEDYGFFYQILNNGFCEVIPENLVVCEIRESGISIRNRTQQLKSRMKVVKHYGRSNALRLLGVLKLVLLLSVTQKHATHIKRILYGI